MRVELTCGWGTRANSAPTFEVDGYEERPYACRAVLELDGKDRIAAVTVDGQAEHARID
jgi:hypothetical protein